MLILLFEDFWAGSCSVLLSGAFGGVAAGCGCLAEPSPCQTGTKDVEDSSEDDDDDGGDGRTSNAREKLHGKRPVEEGPAQKKSQMAKLPRCEERPVTIGAVAEHHRW